MKTQNVLLEKTYAFALRIVKLSRYLTKQKEFVIGKQVLRSGTSIGANAEEAVGGQSENDFFHKIHIAYKEARETHYWLRLLRDSELVEDNRAIESIISDCEEILKILGSIIKTLKERRKSKGKENS